MLIGTQSYVVLNLQRRWAVSAPFFSLLLSRFPCVLSVPANRFSLGDGTPRPPCGKRSVVLAALPIRTSPGLDTPEFPDFPLGDFRSIGERMRLAVHPTGASSSGTHIEPFRRLRGGLLHHLSGVAGSLVCVFITCSAGGPRVGPAAGSWWSGLRVPPVDLANPGARVPTDGLGYVVWAVRPSSKRLPEMTD